MISGLHGESYEEKLKELTLLSLKERRERADMIQTFKILQGLSDVNPGTWFSRINHSRVTRNATDPLNLEIQISRTYVRSNFYSVRVPRFHQTSRNLLLWVSSKEDTTNIERIRELLLETFKTKEKTNQKEQSTTL